MLTSPVSFQEILGVTTTKTSAEEVMVTMEASTKVTKIPTITRVTVITVVEVIIVVEGLIAAIFLREKIQTRTTPLASNLKLTSLNTWLSR